MYELGYWSDKLQRRASFRDMVDREIIDYQDRRFKDLQDRETERQKLRAEEKERERVRVLSVFQTRRYKHGKED